MVCAQKIKKDLESGRLSGKKLAAKHGFSKSGKDGTSVYSNISGAILSLALSYPLGHPMRKRAMTEASRAIAAEGQQLAGIIFTRAKHLKP